MLEAGDVRHPHGPDMSGALSSRMIDAALPPRCQEMARAAMASRRGAWIARVVAAIQAHNKSLETPENRHRCHLCGHDATLLWDPPEMDMGAYLRARFPI